MEQTYNQMLMSIISEQFQTIISEESDFYSGFKIIISNEQQFIKKKDQDINNIYIVVKFLSGNLNYGQKLTPVNFTVLGQGNKIDIVQKLLLDYAQTFNLGEEITIEPTVEDSNRYLIKQIYDQPQVSMNFNETFDNFRSLFMMTGAFLVGANSLPITKIEYFDSASSTQGTEIKIISANTSFNIQLDSQAFYGTDSITTSKSKIGTLTINIVTYFNEDDFCKKIRSIAFRIKKNGKLEVPNGIKEKFYFSITFSDGETVEKMEFSLASFQTMQSIGEFPLLTFTITNWG